MERRTWVAAGGSATDTGGSKLNTLALITHGYPSKACPTRFTFVREFARAVARQGVRVSVICPWPVHLPRRGGAPVEECEKLANGSELRVFRPAFASASQVRFGKWNSAALGQWSFEAAVRSALRRSTCPMPDALYGHFLYHGGAAAAAIGRSLQRPAFVMIGEGALETATPFGEERLRRDFDGMAGVMTNSSVLAEMACHRLQVPRQDIAVFPNGVNREVFFRRNRQEMRRRFGLPEDRFLVICVAKQDRQKGPRRVGEAISDLAGVGGIFLGSGPEPPLGDNVLVSRAVPHEEVPEWLSAADVFALTSTFEGSCNAILEALACGLPVIASEGAFNDDILNDEVALRVDPLAVEDLRSAIVRVKDDEAARIRMGEAAERWSLGFDVDERARRVVAHMRSCAARTRPVVREDPGSTGQRNVR